MLPYLLSFGGLDSIAVLNQLLHTVVMPCTGKHALPLSKGRVLLDPNVACGAAIFANSLSFVS